MYRVHQHTKRHHCVSHSSEQHKEITAYRIYHQTPPKISSVSHFKNTPKVFDANRILQHNPRSSQRIALFNTTQVLHCESRSRQRTIAVLKVSSRTRLTGSSRIENHREWSFILTYIAWRVAPVAVSAIHPVSMRNLRGCRGVNK